MEPASAAGAGFCETGVVRNYMKPLEAMPRLPEVPSTNELPFGPAGLFLSERAVGPIVSGSSLAGFALSFGSPALTPSPRLDWTVAARLVRVARRERARRTIARRIALVKRIGSHGIRRFSFRLPARPSLYRLEIEFRNRAARRIGRFGRYVRVLRPRRDARLILKTTSYRPGEAVSPVLENRGTESLLYGLAYSIESYDGAGWARSPIDRPRPVPLIGLRTGPGETASCWSFTIPLDAPPGLYRFAWSGMTSRETIPARNGRLELNAEFQVVPSTG
jgi:hypothetical protein